jgi:hypothetical protein
MRKIIKITAATITEGNLVLTANVTSKTVCNGERDVFCICTTLPVSTTITPVVLAIGATQVPLLDPIGNTLYSDQIKTRTPYFGTWGTNETHFRLFTCVQSSQATEAQVTIE